MFENVDGRRTDDRVTGILIAHLGAFSSGELIMLQHFLMASKMVTSFSAIFILLSFIS